jgi:hypothetical protein
MNSTALNVEAMGAADLAAAVAARLNAAEKIAKDRIARREATEKMLAQRLEMENRLAVWTKIVSDFARFPR